MTIADQVRFMISQQKYLEHLELGQQKKALATLRQELAPKARDPDDLHRISRRVFRAAREYHLTDSYMVCLDREDLYRTAEWDGAAGSSRRRLLERLQGECICHNHSR